MVEELREVRPGEPVTAAWANAVLRGVRQALRLTVAAPLQMQRGSSGVHLSLALWPRWELCELTADLSAGSSATAHRKTFDGTDWIDAVVEEIEVFDSIGDKIGSEGDRLWAFFSTASGRWEIVQLAC